MIYRRSRFEAGDALHRRVEMEVREDFHHPFTPYDIQRQFMKDLYATLESKSVGIFESPTGTVCGCRSFILIFRGKV